MKNHLQSPNINDDNHCFWGVTEFEPKMDRIEYKFKNVEVTIVYIRAAGYVVVDD